MQLSAAVVLVVLAAGCSEKSGDDVCSGPTTAVHELVIDTECSRDKHVETLTACLASSGPDECVAKIEEPLCDSDGDGLSDDLEASLTRAYAPVFAFNGGAAGGDPETHWPANAGYFVSRARLAFGRSRTTVDARPTLESLGSAVRDGHRADNGCPGEGAEFWLCLDDNSDATRVTSAAAMRAVPGGVDVLSVAHPANGSVFASSHLFVSFSLVFPFNAHSRVNDHEGDWEGIAVFVDRRSGVVDAGWFERHDSVDNERFISNTAWKPRDPAAESPQGTVSAGSGAIHGLRFWDYAGARRHVVAYVSTGGHAMYDYPANTRIMKLGPRDTHNGDGPKLVPHDSRLVSSFGSNEGDAVQFAYPNPGEHTRITLPWARYRGQWGCTDGRIAKSWPGPFGNGRLPRPMFDRLWGSPPVAP